MTPTRAEGNRCASHTLVGLCALAMLLSGCTSLPDYIHNGFKVGPNYSRPAAPVAQKWIDSNDVRVRRESDDLSRWWTVFRDPVLDNLVCDSYRQNVSLRQVGFMVLQARAMRGIAVGELFPQTQQMTGDHDRLAASSQTANGSNISKRFYAQSDFGFNLAWELDFWGRYRRAIESADATLDASVEGYDDALVTLLSDVATNYVELRTFEERIALLRANVVLQRETLAIVTARFRAGTATELDVDQAQSALSQTESMVPQMEILLRAANNQLCVLLGTPTVDLSFRLGAGPIPSAPVEVAVGIPADLLRRRPDVRRAERLAAAQSAQIGIAQSEFYPHISLNGNFDYSAQQFSHLFTPQALNGSFGPAFKWNLLDYGRTLNNVRAQDAQFQALVATYQNSVLTAGQEVENGLASFLRSQEAVKYLTESVVASQKAVNIALVQYRGGTVDFNRVALVEQNLVQQQDLLAQSRGSVASGLIQVYRALGGGWQIRINGCSSSAAVPQLVPPVPERVPPTGPTRLPPLGATANWQRN